MSTAANRLYVPESVNVAQSLLSELRGAHRRLIAEMAAMDRLTAEPLADLTLCATARWRLGQASLQRRLIAARITDYFLHRLDGRPREQLQDLAIADQALLRESSAHLVRWSTRSLSGDWPGFRRDSRDMHRKKHAHIIREQELLYPVLEEAARFTA